MQITTRFTVAIQSMLCIAYFTGTKKVTSQLIADSTNSNPVVIRRLMKQLKDADLVKVHAGVGGAYLTREPKDITLYDIFYAVEATGNELFNFHDNPNCNCPVGKNIHTVLDNELHKIQEAMNAQMRSVTLEKLLDETTQFLIED